MYKEHIIKTFADGERHKINPLTFKQLYEDMVSEMEIYKNLGRLDELMEQPVLLDLMDAEGSPISGIAYLAIGWLENGGVLITGEVNSVYKKEL